MAHDPFPDAASVAPATAPPAERPSPRFNLDLIFSLGVAVMLAALIAIYTTGFGAVTPISQSITAQAAATNVGTDPSDNAVSPPAGTPLIIHVRQDGTGDFTTIQAAVDHAVSGQIILIAPGVYHEAVRVKGAAKSHLTLRGMDRTGVILDGNMGNGTYLPDGVYVGVDDHGTPANDVVIENMTARYYVGNGFYWNGVHGYRGSYLTAYDNGDYGIYAFASTRGQFDHDLASGSPDSGIYIGQCFPCDALVTHVISENSALGYSGTNAGGNLVLRDSIWRYNGTGIAPNTLVTEKLYPQHQVTIVDNLVYANNNEQVPFKALEYPPFGSGIVSAGGVDNLIAQNVVEGQENFGIMVVGNIDQYPDTGAYSLWTPHGVTVRDNTITGSGIADLALLLPAGPDNCFSGNHATRTLPALLQQTNACGTIGARLTGGDLGAFMQLFSRFVNASSWSNARATGLLTRWQTFPAPTEAQPGMPGDLTAPVRPIFTESWTSGSYADLGIADPHATNSTKAVASVGLTSLFAILLGFYSYLLPIALYAAWVGIALWDLARRDDMKSGARYGWMAAVVGIPILGAIAYYILGKSSLTRGFRWMMVGGSLAIWLVATGVLMWASSL